MPAAGSVAHTCPGFARSVPAAETNQTDAGIGERPLLIESSVTTGGQAGLLDIPDGSVPAVCLSDLAVPHHRT